MKDWDVMLLMVRDSRLVAARASLMLVVTAKGSISKMMLKRIIF